jgi:hypothetical protein
VLRLASDPKAVFTTDEEFRARHERAPNLTSEEHARLKRIATEPGKIPASTRYRPYLVLVRLGLAAPVAGCLEVTPAGRTALRLLRG